MSLWAAAGKPWGSLALRPAATEAFLFSLLQADQSVKSFLTLAVASSFSTDAFGLPEREVTAQVENSRRRPQSNRP